MVTSTTAGSKGSAGGSEPPSCGMSDSLVPSAPAVKEVVSTGGGEASTTISSFDFFHPKPFFRVDVKLGEDKVDLSLEAAVVLAEIAASSAEMT